MEDNKPKVFAHTSYIGTGGYNNHSRDFFRHLSKLIDVKVRNFTTSPNWLGVVDEPHNNEDYINNVDKSLLTTPYCLNFEFSQLFSFIVF